jgi:biotin-dependent carboxylase-like uncharacterized protein
MSFEVIKSGFLSTIQDYGRLFYGSQGMSQSGVMDEHAYAWANYLLNNNFNDSVLEITFGGVELKALENMVICVTGADIDFKINQKSTVIWHNLQINKGDVLSWGMAKSGIRAYLAVKNGFKTAVLFSSRSVNLREHIGQKIIQGEILLCSSYIYSTNSNTNSNTKFNNSFNNSIAPKYIPNYDIDIILRILPSYQYDEFTNEQKALFFNQTYTISNANDRSGCRLNGTPIKFKKRKIISEGMSYGSVEIATDGLPIILLKDAPTIGGYLKIGTVFSLDLAKLAQKQPNAKVRFELMNIQQAQMQRVKFNQFFAIDK